jgi:flagellin
MKKFMRGFSCFLSMFCYARTRDGCKSLFEKCYFLELFSTKLTKPALVSLHRRDELTIKNQPVSKHDAVRLYRKSRHVPSFQPLRGTTTMTSILTNIAAMSALQTLRNIGSSMEETQGRVSSGQRVGEAADNAAYWSIATTMKSDNKALSAVQDALGLGAAKIDTAYAGMEAAQDVITEIKAKVVAATEQGVDKAKVQEEISQLQQQLVSIASGASFNGQNWLVFDSTAADAVAEKTVVSGFIRNADGTVLTNSTQYTLNEDATAGTTNVLFGTVDTADYKNSAGGILGTDVAGLGVTTASATWDADTTIVNMDITAYSDADMADALSFIEAGLQLITKAASQLGSISMRIDLQEDFANRLSDAIDAGVGRLVDADMNEESTRLKALQTQQQLGIQALSIANSNSESILTLFR